MYNWNNKEVSKTMSTLSLTHTGFFRAYESYLGHSGRVGLMFSFADKVSHFKLVDFAKFKETDFEESDLVTHYRNAIRGNANQNIYLHHLAYDDVEIEEVQAYLKLYFTYAFKLHANKERDNLTCTLAEITLYYRNHAALELIAKIAKRYSDINFPLSTEHENRKVLVNRLLLASDIDALDWMLDRVDNHLKHLIDPKSLLAAINSRDIETVQDAFYNIPAWMWFEYFTNKPYKKWRPQVWAAKSGNLEVIQFVWSYLKEALKEVFSKDISDRRLLCHDSYRVAYWAIGQGDFAMLNWLCHKADTPQRVTAMLTANNWAGLRLAVVNAQMTMFEFLWHYLHEQQEAIIKYGDYGLFYLAIKSGDINMVLRIWELSGEHAHAMLQANKYLVFRVAVKRGYLDILKLLFEFAGEELPAMLKARNFAAFRQSPTSGNHEVVTTLWQAAGENPSRMLKCGDKAQLKYYELWHDFEPLPQPYYFKYGVFIKAIKHDRLYTVEWLWDQAGENAMTMLRDSKYAAFLVAVETNNFRMMNWLWEKAGAEAMAMLRAEGFHVFEHAVDEKEQDVLEWLWDKADEQVRAELLQQKSFSKMLAKYLDLVLPESDSDSSDEWRIVFSF